jgi:CHASE2 domain-containing sensor protein
MDLVVAFPAMFWGGIWLIRKQPLGYLVGGLLLVKAASVGLTLVVTSWLVTWWGEPLDPMLPAYAVVGLGGVVLSWLYLRNVGSVRRESPAGATHQLAHRGA